MMRSRCKRGSLMLGLAALTVLLGVLTAAVLESSLRGYHASAQAQWKLQAMAAAEGAALLLETKPQATRDPIELGNAAVSFGEAVPSETALVVPLRVDLLSKEGRVMLSQEYDVFFEPRAEEYWTLVSVERRT